MNIVRCVANNRTIKMAANKVIYPAADRNKDPILFILKRYIRNGADQTLLEIASGTGQHVAHFAPHFPQVTFYPSEYDAGLLDSIVAHTGGITNVREPSRIDVTTDCRTWAGGIFKEKSLDYIYCANMLHISPYQSAVGLFEGAGTLLKDDGVLFTYGPYAMNGNLTPESNVTFNDSLKSQNSEWGIRDVYQELEELAKKNYIQLDEIWDMPANNKTVVWHKY